MTATDEANRLAKYRSVYAGALAELGSGRPIGLLPKDWPGIMLVRDLIEKVLLTRAEINGLSKIVVEAKLVTQERFDQIMAEEYAWLADAHEKLTGYKAHEAGLTITPESARAAIQYQLKENRGDAP